MPGARPSGGFILRTNGEDATDAELAEDIAYLRKTWARIRERRLRLPPTSLLHQDLSLLQRVLRDLVNERHADIRIDSREQFEHSAGLRPRVHAAARPSSCSSTRASGRSSTCIRIDEEIAKALGRRVELKSGGYLIVDQTEALTTVDVNTGGFVGARNFDDTIFKTNLEAAQAIARQLRLRNLGGIIIVDFIDMARDDHRDAVLAEFRKQLGARPRQDHGGRLLAAGPGGDDAQAHARIAGPHAVRALPGLPGQGHGEDRAQRLPTTSCARSCARRGSSTRASTASSPRRKVIELFLDEESQHLAGLSDFIGKPISLQSESAMGQEQYDIVLLQRITTSEAAGVRAVRTARHKA